MRPFTIYLAADSTVQTFKKKEEPQMGWGQKLYEYFKGSEACRIYHPDTTSFEQVTKYDLPDVSIDNRAMAGRSSRSFREEGRLKDIEKVIQPGDFMFIQFAHNDANKGKEERYVPVERYGESLKTYADVCRAHGAQCVLVTAIAMRNCEENAEGKFTYSFPEYRDAMIAFAREENLPLLDLGKRTTQYCQSLGSEGCKDIFLWVKPGEYPESSHRDGKQDNAHLKAHGAKVFAGLLADLIREYDADERLKPIQDLLKGKNNDEADCGHSLD